MATCFPFSSRANEETSPKSLILCEASNYVARFCATNNSDASRIAWPEQVASRRRAEWRPAFPFTEPSFPGAPFKPAVGLSGLADPCHAAPLEPSLRACHPDAKRKDPRLFFSGASPTSTSHAPPELNKPPLYQGTTLACPERSAARRGVERVPQRSHKMSPASAAVGRLGTANPVPVLKRKEGRNRGVSPPQAADSTVAGTG